MKNVTENIMKIYNHFVDGKEMEPNSGEYFDTENPYTCENWAKLLKEMHMMLILQ